MIEHDVDVLIVGAGPAGSSAAISLAQLGYRVVLADRAKFPRPHVGESLPPKIDRLFDILGVRTQIQAAGFLRMRGTTVHQGERALTHDFDPDPRVLGYQVDRARFDALLIARAREAGATILEETAVADPAAIARARFVIDAGGQRSTLARSFGARRRESIRTVALTGYYRGSRAPAEFPAENTLFEMRAGGWLWSVLLADGRRNITVGIDPEILKGRGPSEIFAEMVSTSPLVSGLVAAAALDGELVAHDVTWYSSDQFAGLGSRSGKAGPPPPRIDRGSPGYLIAGDAASFIDPLTAHGVYKAIHSGITAAAVINTVVRRPNDAAMAVDYYNAHQRRTYEKYAEIALTFYRASPFVSSPFWEARTRPERVGAVPTMGRVDDFWKRVRGPGASAMVLRGRGVSVARRAIAEGYFVVEKEMLVAGDEEIAAPDPGFDPRAFAELLDGRTLEQLFEGYVAKTGKPRSKALGQLLITILGKLAERDALE